MNSLVILLPVAAYFLGALPWGVFIGKLHGVSLLDEGSGNTGFTNTFRILGPIAAVIVLLGDLGKGWLAASMPIFFLDEPFFALQVICGVMALIGNSYSVFLNFRGGKAVTTSTGVVLAMTPSLLPLVLLVWIALLVTTRYMSLSSLIAVTVLPVSAIIKDEKPDVIVFTLMIAGLVFFRHRDNIRRLAKGEERRFEWKKSAG